MKIGVLDIQGSVVEHVEALGRCRGLEIRSGHRTDAGKAIEDEGGDFEIVRVKKPANLADVAGLIIPGGESTTIGKLLRRFGLREEIIKRYREGMAIWGTCAGAILLAKKIVGEQKADTLALMEIEIERNAYGRQMDSFEGEVNFLAANSVRRDERAERSGGGDGDGGGGGWPKKIPAVFIRAPKIVNVGRGVEVLGTVQGTVLGTVLGTVRGATKPNKKNGDLGNAVYDDCERCNHVNSNHSAVSVTRQKRLLPVAVRQGRLLATTFHPELSEDLALHRYFVEMAMNHH